MDSAVVSPAHPARSGWTIRWQVLPGAVAFSLAFCQSDLLGHHLIDKHGTHCDFMSVLPTYSSTSIFPRVLVTISRLCITVWFGASLFFVSIVIGLRGSPLFTDETKLSHPKVLFPLFYTFEFWLLGGALLFGVAALWNPTARTKTQRAYLVFVGLALLVALGDYFAIYRPLDAMLDMSKLPAEFRTYHVLSRWVNTAGVLFCGAASLIGLWPASHDTQQPR